MDLTPDGEFLIIFTEDIYFKIYDKDLNFQKGFKAGHDLEIKQMLIANDGKTIYGCNKDRKIKIFEVTYGAT